MGTNKQAVAGYKAAERMCSSVGDTEEVFEAMEQLNRALVRLHHDAKVPRAEVLEFVRAWEEAHR